MRQYFNVLFSDEVCRDLFIKLNGELNATSYSEKGKTVGVGVSLGFNVSADTITSDIRVSEDPLSAIIASWVVTFETDGTDGDLLLTLDSTITTAIVQTTGYMDLKRVAGGPPLPIFVNPSVLLVNFTPADPPE